MKMWVATTLLVAFTATVMVSARIIDDIVRHCPEGEFYNEKERFCEPCSECSDFLYERQSCSKYRDTVCGWCGDKKLVKNLDYYRKCKAIDEDLFDEKNFERNFKTRIMNSILKEESEKTSDEVIDADELPDTRSLPPLPIDDEYEEYYDDDEFFNPISHDDVPSSEEELHGKEILEREELERIRESDEYSEDEEKDEKEKKREFAPISGSEFLRKEKHTIDAETEKEMEEDGVRPVKINEDKIDEEDEMAGETDEFLDRKGHHIDIVAIAVRKKGTKDSNEEDDYESTSNYSSVCHTLGLYIYALCFLVLAAVILKRCFKPVYSVPVMNLTEEQCAMIHRCAHQMKNSKDIAIYENDMAYV